MIYFRNRLIEQFSTAELLAIQAAQSRIVRPLRLFAEVSAAIAALAALEGASDAAR